MKKIIFLFLPIIAFAGLDMSEVNSVLLSISASKKLKYYNFEINNSIDKKINFTSFNDADILLFPKESHNTKTPDNKIIIVNSYQKLKNNKNSIGAIYLKKNRTQIIFIKERLKKYSLSLPEKFNKYIISICHFNSICID